MLDLSLKWQSGAARSLVVHSESLRLILLVQESHKGRGRGMKVMVIYAEGVPWSSREHAMDRIAKRQENCLVRLLGHTRREWHGEALRSVEVEMFGSAYV